MRSRPKGPLTDGARKLLAYLEKKKLSIPSFCEQHDLPRIAVQRALNGDRQRFGVDFACGVEGATGGQVVCSDWRAATLREGQEILPPITKKRAPALRVAPKAAARKTRKAA